MARPLCTCIDGGFRTRRNTADPGQARLLSVGAGSSSRVGRSLPLERHSVGGKRPSTSTSAWSRPGTHPGISSSQWPCPTRCAPLPTHVGGRERIEPPVGWGGLEVSRGVTSAGQREYGVLGALYSAAAQVLSCMPHSRRLGGGCQTPKIARPQMGGYGGGFLGLGGVVRCGACAFFSVACA